MSVDIPSQIAINPGGESTTVCGRISQGANKLGGESSRGRNGKGAKKPDTASVSVSDAGIFLLL